MMSYLILMNQRLLMSHVGRILQLKTRKSPLWMF
uniref:Uncharacterized protein n=1 Tax=Rhizophora mucronata TaxID=61149 RepID=A0A2P2PYS9_RHIMU